jgi:hypothetical protein
LKEKTYTYLLSLRRSIIDRVIQMNVHPIDIRPLLSLNVKLQIEKNII